MVTVLLFNFTGFKNFDRIFLITEVFYVSEVKVHVGIADKEDTFFLKGWLVSYSKALNLWYIVLKLLL